MNIIQKLRQTNSRVEKQRILAGMTEQERRVFWYAYNPHRRYGITSMTPRKELGEPTNDMFRLLNELASNNINDELRQKVRDFRAANGDLIVLICRKDLDCGVTATTVNKVWPELIPVFKVQLAKEVPLDKLVYPLVAQIKYDGVRVIILAANGWCKLFTRNGKIINFPSLSEPLAVLFADIPSGVMIDGELTNKAGTMDGRTTISGRVNSAIKGGVLSGDDVAFNAFDTMKLDDFNKGIGKCKYSTRYETLRQLVEYVDSDIITLAHNLMVKNAEEANNYYTHALEQGYEGLILKSAEHRYTFKRSKDWVKVKAIKTVDLECIDTQNGREGTKYSDSIGILVCKGMIDGKCIKVNVGSGLSDDDRRIENHTKFKGSTVEVKYNDVIPAFNGIGYTLFLPRFVAIRFDK